MSNPDAASARRIGVYPGTFDPITNGHRDVVLRAVKVLDRLVVGVAKNAGKGPLFDAEERAEMVRGELLGIDFMGIKTQRRAMEAFKQEPNEQRIKIITVHQIGRKGNCSLI